MNRWLLVLITLILGISSLVFVAISSGPKDSPILLGIGIGMLFTAGIALGFKVSASVVANQKITMIHGEPGYGRVLPNRPPAPCGDNATHYDWVDDGWMCPYCAADADHKNQLASENRLARKIAGYLK